MVSPLYTSVAVRIVKSANQRDNITLVLLPRCNKIKFKHLPKCVLEYTTLKGLPTYLYYYVYGIKSIISGPLMKY